MEKNDPIPHLHEWYNGYLIHIYGHWSSEIWLKTFADDLMDEQHSHEREQLQDILKDVNSHLHEMNAHERMEALDSALHYLYPSEMIGELLSIHDQYMISLYKESEYQINTTVVSKIDRVDHESK